MVRSSRCRTRSWPCSPWVDVIGARFSLVRKNRFPFPPAPPNAAMYSWPCSERSVTVLSCSLTTVPNGTFKVSTYRRLKLTRELKYMPSTHLWTHMNIRCIAIPAITILAAPRLPVFSLVDRNNLSQRFNKPIGCKETNNQSPWDVFCIPSWRHLYKTRSTDTGPLPLITMLPPSPPFPPSGPPHSLRGSL